MQSLQFKLFILVLITGAICATWYYLPFFESKSSETPVIKSIGAQGTIQKESEAKVTFAALARDAALVESGKQTFNTNCVSCHGPLGGGLVGPNLTDDYWIHDPYFENLYRIVMEGVAEKGMPAQGPVIGATGAKSSLAYIATLRGSNPTNAKAPEGTPQALQ